MLDASMDDADLRLYYNRCSDDPLPFGDARYVDIDGAVGRPRGHSWVERLAKKLELSDEPERLLVTGLRGTGKSTELFRLEQRLARPDGAHQLVVLIDGGEVIDLANEIDVPDVLTAIVHATERRVLEAEGTDPKLARVDGYLTRLWTWLARIDVPMKELELTPAQQGGLVAEMKTRPTLRQKVRSALAEHFSTFLQEVREELVLLERRAQKVGFRRIAVIFDSLEKLQGLSTNWREVLRSTERVFGTNAHYLRLPVHVVYTVPPALLIRRTDHIDFLPMIKLFDRDGKRHEAGFAVMRDIVDQRIAAPALADLLGKAYAARIDELIRRSGGDLRQLLQSLRWLLALPELPASSDDVQRLFAEQRERYQAVVANEDRGWLARVARTKTLMIDEPHSLERVDRALSNGVLFRYANGDVWYDINPALQEDVPPLRGRFSDLPDTNSIQLTSPQTTRSAQRVEISEIRIRGFKSIDDVGLELGKVTVLLGENGCGKSNILEAIAFASAAVGRRLDHEFLASRGIRVADADLMRPAFADGREAPMVIGVRSKDDPPVDFEFCEDASSTIGGWSSSATFPEHDAARRLGKRAGDVLDRYAAELGRFLVFSPENSSLRAFQSEGQILPLGIKGEGLFAHLQALQHSGRDDVLRELNHRLGLIDWFSGFEIPGDLGPGEHRLDIRDRFLRTRTTLDQRSANEGFLFLLFYFTLLISPETPKFFAVDNIDASLNPRLCARLMADVVELAKRNDRRVIATTHNAALLDGLDLGDPEQRLIVVSRGPRGATRIRRVPPPRAVEGAPSLRLSEAFVRGYLGGLPGNF